MPILLTRRHRHIEVCDVSGPEIRRREGMKVGSKTLQSRYCQCRCQQNRHGGGGDGESRRRSDEHNILIDKLRHRSQARVRLLNAFISTLQQGEMKTKQRRARRTRNTDDGSKKREKRKYTIMIPEPGKDSLPVLVPTGFGNKGSSRDENGTRPEVFGVLPLTRFGLQYGRYLQRWVRAKR